MMKLILLTLFAALLVFGQTMGVCAQSPEKILKRATKALGGEKALRGVVSRRATGRITRLEDGATGNYQTDSLNPNLYAETFDLDGFEIAAGYNGKSAWARDSKNGLQTLTGAASRDFQAFVRYRNRLWLDYKKDKAKVFANAPADVNGKKADGIVLANAKSARIKIYFDPATSLPVREEFVFSDSVKTFDYADYRVVNGVNEPFAVAVTDGNQKYAIKFDRVVHNEQIARNVFDFPVASTEPLPDIAALMKEVAANEDRVDEILENYTYVETQTSREVGADGALREKEVEKRQITFYKGRQIRRLIAKNGKPLSPDDYKSEEKKAAESIADIEAESVKQTARENSNKSAKEQTGTSGDRISIGEILRASSFKNPRRELFRNRSVIVFDFEPNPQFDFKSAKSLLKFFGKTAGALWIDEKDKQVARVEAHLTDNFNVAGGLVAKLKRGASFTLEQNRVNDEIWLPASADVNLSIKLLLVKGININQLVRYSDYQKFKTEVEGAEVNKAKKSEF